MLHGKRVFDTEDVQLRPRDLGSRDAETSQPRKPVTDMAAVLGVPDQHPFALDGRRVMLDAPIGEAGVQPVGNDVEDLQPPATADVIDEVEREERLDRGVTVRCPPHVGSSDLVSKALVHGTTLLDARFVTPWRLRAGDTPDWSPDGKTILFHSNQAGPPEISGNLFTVRATGFHPVKLTFAHGGLVQYLGSSYSPDGKWIVFARRPATGGPDANAADVFIMRTDGSHKQHVTRTKLYDSYPDWGPAINNS